MISCFNQSVVFSASNCCFPYLRQMLWSKVVGLDERESDRCVNIAY